MIVNSKQDINERDEKVVIRKKIESVDTISQFCDLIEKYEKSEISQEEFNNIRKNNFFKIAQTFENANEREINKMVIAYEDGLISEQEFEVFKHRLADSGKYL